MRCARAEPGRNGPAEHTASAMAEHGDRTGLLDLVAGELGLDLTAQPLRTPRVDGKGGPRGPVSKPPQPSVHRFKVEIVAEEAGEHEDEPPVAPG